MTNVNIRESSVADYEAVRNCMCEVFLETGGQKLPGFSKELWDWQYLGNEQNSVIILAEDGSTICGYYHVLLFNMRFQDQPSLGAMVQDVGTLRSHRGQGIFKKMGGFALERLLLHKVDFIYTFPNSKSLPSFVRNHEYSIVARAPVYIVPLDLGPLVSARIHFDTPGKFLGRFSGWLYRTVLIRHQPLSDNEEVVQLDRFEEDAARLSSNLGNSVAISLERTARYLNWRFIKKPTQEYAVWGLRRNGRLYAYVVTRKATLFSVTCVLLMDFGCSSEDKTALYRLVAARLTAERASGTSLGLCMGIHPLFSQLKILGFLRIPERFNPRPFNLLAKNLTKQPRSEFLTAENWMITFADWDVF